LPSPPNVDQGTTQATAPTEPPVVPAPEPFRREIGLPIAGLSASDIYDTFDQPRGGGERAHEATDIMAPRGTPVYAVDAGVIRKLFKSVQGGLTVYQFDPGEEYVYYYAHLDRYAERLREGMKVKRGDLIGYVGSTGNADPGAPHLHFAILELGPEKNWGQDNRAINPYPSLTGALARINDKR
jgi:murein DD-endopeptidase MepM/ murein hydrolase activator NlpD